MDQQDDRPALINTALVVVSVVFPILSAASVAGRFQARIKGNHPVKSDDWMIVVSWVFTFGMSIMVWAFAGTEGVNASKLDSLAETVQESLCVLVMTSYVQFPLASVKIAILLFYKRIFVKRSFAIAVWIAIPLIAIWGVLFFLLEMLQSDPVRGSWEGKGRLRFDSFALGLAQVGTSIGLDLVILCFPLPLIATLHMATSRKVAVAIIFWLGIFCTVAASVRFWLLYTSVQQVINGARGGDGGFTAIFFQTKNLIFAIIEPNCSVIAACLPCYGPLFPNGRAPESLVRSVRSLFSIGSANSRRRGSDEAAKGASREQRAETDVELRDLTAGSGEARANAE